MDISNINPIITGILKKRGITGQEEIREFLSEKPRLTYDPFLLHDMKEGVDFVLSSIKNNEKICIYGDYDVDGITATALLYNFLKDQTDNLVYYIPSRFDEGYGLNKEAITHLKEEGVESIITVDCGSVSKKEVEYAKSIGIKIMVTDHHSMQEETTPDCIVINPKHYDSRYPFQDLCGCAVAFKLIQAIVRVSYMKKSILTEYLVLVALATIADVVSVKDENRTILKYGLREICRGSNKALNIMMNKLDIEINSVDSYKIGFILAPHMNAAGRISSASEVVRMLVSGDDKEIEDIIDSLIENNKERKAIQEKCFEECIDTIESNYEDDLFLILKPSSVHEGIAGIVASKIKEKYNKPAIVLSESVDESGNRIFKGSGRSIDDINLIQVLQSHKEFFSKLGGHAMAAGFSMAITNESSLRDILNKEMEEKLRDDADLFIRKTETDAVIGSDDVTIDLANNIKLLAPFGAGNHKPVLRLDNVKATNIRYIGNNKQHVKFIAENIDCILFGKAQENRDLLAEGNSIKIYGTPEVNSWMGRDNVQLTVREITENGDQV